MKKKAYFIGIAGATMSGLALAFKKMGWDVSGSDQKEVYPPITTLLEKNKVPFFRGYSAKHLTKQLDLVVVGRSALMVNPENPEYIKAKKICKKVLSFPEVIRDFLIKKNSIVVAGTYGKTTTTALITWILITGGFNPSFMIGGIPLNFSESTRITDSEYSVVEGDETPALLSTDPPKFMFYRPKYLVLTATEYDHPEIYKTKEAYLEAYIDLVKLLPQDGIMFYEPKSVAKEVVNVCQCKKIPYLKESLIKIDGSFRESALRAITVCLQLGIPPKTIEKSIRSFNGLKARQELLGVYGGRYLYHDFAQHPAKVKSALQAVRGKHPRARIIVVFNPSATSLKYKETLDGYKRAFLEADEVIIAKIDFLAGISKEDRVTGPDLQKAFGEREKIIYEPIYEKIVDRLWLCSKGGDIIIFMSSGGLKFFSFMEQVKSKLKRDRLT